MTFCHQNKIHSAVDFKAIIEQHLKDSKPKDEKGVQILNPLSGSKLDKNIQPQKSSIQDLSDTLGQIKLTSREKVKSKICVLGSQQKVVLIFGFYRDDASQLRKVF
jgi:hypothetical protein